MTVKAAAEIIGVTPGRVRQMIKAGTIIAHRMKGRRNAYYISRAAVDDVMKPKPAFNPFWSKR
jgi:excisionase family DNA binding protein